MFEILTRYKNKFSHTTWCSCCFNFSLVGVSSHPDVGCCTGVSRAELVHRLSAETLEVPMSEGLQGTAVTPQFSSSAAAAVSSFVLGGGVLGRGTIIPAGEAKQAAVLQCLLAPCRYAVHPPHKQLFQHTTRRPSAIQCRGCSRDSMF